MTLTACRLCGEPMQRVRNRSTKELTHVVACEHCDNPCSVGRSCRQCRRADKASA